MTLVAKGELDEMRHLYERYKGRIYSFSLMMVRDKDLSRDITQEVFYKIINSRHTYKGMKFAPWIYTIARNLCHDQFKLRAKMIAHHSGQEHLEDIVEEKQESMGSDELLNQALNRLSLEDKEMILMSRFQKLKYTEIAEVANTTVGAVKTRVHRALMKLKVEYFKIENDDM